MSYGHPQGDAAYHRGIELYGAIASRFEEPAIQASLKELGLVVVEGMNDMMRLDELGVCAVGLCSNRATDRQIGLIAAYARTHCSAKVLLFPDADEECENGFKELLWSLAELPLSNRLLSEKVYNSEQNVPQPESFSSQQLSLLYETH